MSQPGLLPDARVLRLDDAGILVELDVDPRSPVLAGHYPGFPLLPGMFTLDATHHAVLRHAADRGVTRPRLVGIESARFAAAVFPGDRLTIECEIAVSDDLRRVTAGCRTDRGRAATFRLRYRDTGAGLDGAGDDGHG